MPLVYLDTNVLIRVLEGEPGIAAPILTLLPVLQQPPGLAVTSELTLAEVPAPVKHPAARTVADRLVLHDRFFDAGFVDLIEVSRSVRRDSALLRETHPQTLADAIHVATALRTGCAYLMSGDADLKPLPPPLKPVPPDAARALSVMGALHK